MNQHADTAYIPVRETNPLGVAGFVCSLIGLVLTGGLLSPIGLILSLVALGRQPRGFAIAGVVLGLVGTCGVAVLIVAVVALGLAAVAALVGVLMLSNPQRLELTSDMINSAIAIEKYRQENHYLPAELSLLGLDEPTLIDPWGTKYQYVQVDPQREFDIISAGQDKQFDTPDDIALSKLGKQWHPAGSIRVESDGKGGTVHVDVDGRTIEVKGTEAGGAVTIDVGERGVEVVPGQPTDTTGEPAESRPDGQGSGS